MNREFSTDAQNSFALASDGPSIASERDATEVIGDALGAGAELVVIPVSRLSPEFFRLSSGLAGSILQKFTNYRLRVAIIGDISGYTAKSGPLRDFVRESNARGGVRFLASEADL
ncbi:MAG TPA: DUF4180 domain-containing protein [Devosia sp.]|nr:DUF4180 domain-containing protein [Devosia sp.]